MTPKRRHVQAICQVFDCSSCVHLAEERCRGCVTENEQLVAEGGRPCSIFECARGRGIESCDECESAPCPMGRIDHLCVIMARHSSDLSWRQALAVHLARRGAEVVMAPELHLGERTVGRLRRYLATIDDLIERGERIISSWDIAHHVGVKPGLVRKDLSYLGRQLGTPSVGYDAGVLKQSILDIMGMNEPQRCVWIGARSLLAEPQHLDECERQGIQCLGVFDEEPGVIGRPLSAELTVRPLAELPDALRSERVSCAIIGAGFADPQAAADQLVRSGVRAILNLSPRPVRVPEGVTVHQGDLATQLFTLAYTARL